MTMRKPLDAEAMYRTILSNPEKLPVRFTLDGRAQEGLRRRSSGAARRRKRARTA